MTPMVAATAAFGPNARGTDRGAPLTVALVPVIERPLGPLS